MGEVLECGGSNVELHRMIAQVGCHAPREVFFRVAAEMFADGTFNWGRVVALFYFACKLVIKVRRRAAPPAAGRRHCTLTAPPIHYPLINDPINYFPSFIVSSPFYRPRR
uniref:Bcl-2 Bcl-2 homology region 1-3 domain-containing protein n=1 Tax=Phasianus colchicus TaxID=9054 RepID=A0A669QJ01_PHACC